MPPEKKKKNIAQDCLMPRGSWQLMGLVEYATYTQGNVNWNIY